ncbi:MAG TPA: hypothetical protein VEV13_05800, partial [Candidatus Limnocylindria bacterium]|nr:hypothetical protein [Candidatus Limnocylindria bacterium]
ALGVALAAWRGWPAQFGTDGSSPAGAGWLTDGSALSAPVGFWVLLGVTLGLSLVGRSGRRAATVASAVLALLAAIVVAIAGVGEAVAGDPVTAPRAALVGSGVVAAVFAVALIWAAIHDLRQRNGVVRPA